MTNELSKRIALLLRYYGWLAIYFLLFFGVSLSLAYIADIYFPETITLLGRPASVQRIVFALVYITVITALIWPVWHKLGDLFLPDQDRWKRFKNLSTATNELQRLLKDKYIKRTDQSS